MTKNRRTPNQVTTSTGTLERLTELEAIRERVLAGDYAGALELAQAVQNPPPVVDYWRGICLTGLGSERAVEAKHVLKLALARGYAGAVGMLAAAERLAGENREYLKQINPADYSGFDAYDRAALLREIGISYEDDDLATATKHLEAAWKTAQSGPHAKLQLAFVGHVYGTMLRKCGFDARALPILTEALKFTSRTRRVDLLYLRCLINLELHNLEAVELDLAEMKMFIPSNPELPPVVVYTEARLARARGGDNLPLALSLFEQAAELGRIAETDTEFFGVFGACSVQLERGIPATVLKQKQAYDADIVEVGAENYHLQMLDLAETPRLRAFTALREALILASKFDPRAVDIALKAVDAFRELHHRREEGWALLTLAETHLFLNQGQANAEAVAALERASEIGLELGVVMFARELRLLPRVRSFLGDLEADSTLRELLV